MQRQGPALGPVRSRGPPPPRPSYCTHVGGTYQAGCCSTSLPSKEKMRAPGFSWPWEPENKASQLGNSSSSCGGKWGCLPISGHPPTEDHWLGALADQAPPPAWTQVWDESTTCGPETSGASGKHTVVAKSHEIKPREGHCGAGALLGSQGCGQPSGPPPLPDSQVPHPSSGSPTHRAVHPP